MLNRSLSKTVFTALLLCLVHIAFAQSRLNVSGVVKDVSGEPVVGASIIVNGTTNGTSSDINGQFNLSVAPNSTLQISCIGYVSQEVAVGTAPVYFNIVLVEDNTFLEDVVVVGYGTQAKANLTGAVAAVSGDVLEDRPVTNLGQALQGVIPNLNITMNSGGAPGASSNYNIRGTTSLNGGGPLVLVDNVQMDANLVNPEDIESVSVLKDAASAAIYGARAAYGVILITTKRGKQSEKPIITFSANGYVQTPAVVTHTVNSLQFLDMMDSAYQNDGGSGHYYHQSVYEYTKKYMDGTYPDPVFFDEGYSKYKYGYCGNTDWWQELYGPSFSQIYNASITGGSARTKYYVSFGYNNQHGVLKVGKDKYQKYNASINVSSDVTKWLNISAKITDTFTDELHPTGGSAFTNSTARSGLSSYSGQFKADLMPIMPVKHPDGNYAGQGDYTNPVALQEIGGNGIYKQNDLWLSGAVKVTPFKGLILNADYTFNVYNKYSHEHVQSYYDYTAVPGTENYYPWTNPNSVGLTNNNNWYKALNVYAEYTFDIEKNHNFKFLVGYNQETKHTTMNRAGRLNLIDNTNPSINLAYGEQRVGGSESIWAVNGVFARFNYDYKGKYLLEFNGRYDGTSKFAEGSRYAFFPSASAAWRISEEDFWTPLKSWWNNLKFRVSYGSLGNQAVSSNFPYLATYGINTAYSILFNGALPVAVTAPGLVSGSLTWETVNQLNFGVDMAFLDNRLTTEFDWYRRDTKDMLSAGEALPATLGASVPQENAADLRTSGWELILSWRDQTSGGFGYHFRGVLSDNKTVITKFANPTGLLSQNYVGKVMGEIWGYTSYGLFQSDAEVASSPSQKSLSSGNWGAGDVKYEDINGDGVISRGAQTLSDPGDRQIIGNSTAHYHFGVTAGFDYKGIDFEVFFQGVGKRDWDPGQWNSGFWGFTNQWCTPQVHSLDYWTPDNTDAFWPRLHHGGVVGGNHQTSTRYLQDASYVRVKNIVLGYSFPAAFLNKINVQRLRLYLQGENLFTFHHLDANFDPETLDSMTYPINKKISFGLNLTF